MQNQIALPPMSRDYAISLLQLTEAAIAGQPVASRRTSPILIGFANILEQAIASSDNAAPLASEEPPTPPATPAKRFKAPKPIAAGKAASNAPAMP